MVKTDPKTHKKHIKMTDFGLSREMLTSLMFSSVVGTNWYMPPQFFKNQKQEYTYEVDVWAVGIVLMEVWLECRVNNHRFEGGLIPAKVESFPTEDQLEKIKDLKLRWIVAKSLIRDPQNRGSMK